MAAIEIRRAFSSAGFSAAIIAVVLLATAHAALGIVPEVQILKEAAAENFPIATMPVSVFNRWIGGGADVFSGLAFTALPLIAAWPYSSSFYADMKTGYASIILTRARPSAYLTSKVLAVFLTGAVAVGLMLITDFIATALFLPLAQPNSIMSELTTLTNTSYWAEIFFSNAWLYTGIYLGMNMLFGGLIACTALPFSFVLSNGFLVMASPFLLNILITQLTSKSSIAAFAPSEFLNPCQTTTFDPALAMAYGGACVAAIIMFLIIAKRKDCL